MNSDDQVQKNIEKNKNRILLTSQKKPGLKKWKKSVKEHMNNDNRQNRDYNLWTYEDLVEHITTLNSNRINAIWAAIEWHHPVWYHTVIDDLEQIDEQHGMEKAHLYEQIRNHADSQAAYKPASNLRRLFDLIPQDHDFNPFEAIHRLNCNHTFKVAQISTRLIETGNLYFLDRIELLDAANERIQALLYDQARLNIQQARAARPQSPWG